MPILHVHVAALCTTITKVYYFFSPLTFHKQVVNNSALPFSQIFKEKGPGKVGITCFLFDTIHTLITSTCGFPTGQQYIIFLAFHFLIINLNVAECTCNLG